ncbi:MAG: hypothetical protein RIR89_1218, partial [Actinomycetota bacterium]
MKQSKASSSRWLLLVLLNSGFVQAGVYVVRPMITYRSVDLGADPWLVGLVGATFALAPLLFAIVVGRWVDRGRDGLAMFLGSGTLIVTSIAVVFINDIPLLMIAMPFLGIGHLLVMVGGQSMIANRAADSVLERNFGLLTLYASMGHAVGPFVGGLLADRGGVEVDTVPAIIFATGLFIGATLVVFGLVSSKGTSKINESRSFSDVKSVLATPTYKSAIFVAGAITAVVDVVLIFLPLLGRELGLSATQIGALLASRAAFSMAVRAALGPLSKRFGMLAIINLGALVTMFSMIALALVTDFWILMIVVAIAGLAMGIGQPATMAWVSRISKEGQKGLAISIRLTS